MKKKQSTQKAQENHPLKKSAEVDQSEKTQVPSSLDLNFASEWDTASWVDYSNIFPAWIL